MRSIPYQSESTPSFQELSAWACLGSTLAVYIPYFAYVHRIFYKEPWRGGLMMTRVLESMVLAVAIHAALNGVIHVYLAARQRPAAKDERDFLIEARSFRFAYRVLVVLLLSVIFVVPGCVAQRSGHITSFPFTIQVVLLSFVTAEASKYLVRALAYRRDR